jgi:hypothetical protein
MARRRRPRQFSMWEVVKLVAVGLMLAVVAWGYIVLFFSLERLGPAEEPCVRPTCFERPAQPPKERSP